MKIFWVNDFILYPQLSLCISQSDLYVLPFEAQMGNSFFSLHSWGQFNGPKKGGNLIKKKHRFLL